MKLYPGSSSLASVTLAGILIAACSSKTTDNSGTDNGTGNTTSAGAAAGTAGGGANTSTGGRSNATGGSLSNPGTGGGVAASNLPQACPGLNITASAADAGAVDADAGLNCSGVGVELEPAPLDMFIMQDRTQSMTYTVQNTSLQRWDVLEQGVQQYLNDTSVQAAAPRIGLGYFGITGNSNDPTECLASSYATPTIGIGPVATTGPEILDWYTNERALLGGLTPWFPALQGALTYAQNWQIANPNRMTVVVLVTDGYATECDQSVTDTQEMVGEFYAGVVGQYNTTGQPGIRTYIIGIAVDKFNLNDVAQAGGTGAAYIVDSTGAVSEFVSAMDNITNANISCTLDLPTPPQGQVLDPNKVQVVYEPFSGPNQEIPFATASGGCGTQNGGWYFNNTTPPTQVILCPCSCANLGAGSIQVRFGCKPQVRAG